MAPLKIGILMVPYQTIDVAMPLDIISSCQKSTFEMFKRLNHPDARLLPQAIDAEFYYIGVDKEPVELTAGAKGYPDTATSTCPPLNILLIGGPDPINYHLPPAFTAFIQSHVSNGGTLWCTCTGALMAASTGVLDGRRATVNWELLEYAKSVRPQVLWEKERWVVDLGDKEGKREEGKGKGELRTAGGACAGMDMVAQWVIEKYGREVASVGFRTLDYVGRGLDGNLVEL